MTIAVSTYLNRPYRSAQEVADDLEFDAVRLDWLRLALLSVIEEHAKITRDYPFLGDETAAAAQKEIGAVKAKIGELRERIATLTPGRR